MERELKWHYRFIGQARVWGSYSKDPRKKVGAVITRDCVPLGQGYNGFPKGVADTPERYADKPLKRKLIVHAERNAIHNCEHKPTGGTIYVAPLAPCAGCAGDIIQSGIKLVVCQEYGEDEHPNWREEKALADMMFCEAGVKVLALTMNPDKDLALLESLLDNR